MENFDWVDIDFARLEADQEQFGALSPKQKKRYLMLTLHLRDVSLLLKFLLFGLNEQRTSEPQSFARNSMVMCCLTILISKLCETWKFITKNKLTQEIELESTELKGKFEEVQSFFEDKKISGIFSFVRDKFGFHYEYQNDIDNEIDQAFGHFSEVINWLPSDNPGNEIFASSHIITLYVIVQNMKKVGFEGDDKKLMGELMDIAQKASGLLQDFARLFIVHALPVKWKQTTQMRLQVPCASSINLPAIAAIGRSDKKQKQ